MNSQVSVIDFDDDSLSFINAHNELVSAERRNFLKLIGSGVIATSVLGIFSFNPTLAKKAISTEREIKVFTPALGEQTRIVYWIPGEGYIKESLRELSWAMRDRRTNTARIYDPHALDQLFALRLQLQYQKPTHVLSGYRSPQTNAMLRRSMRGVAKESLHMKGKAIDIRMPGISTSDLRNAAVSLRAGGVGYYSRSAFVHIDSGQVRTWGK